LYPYVQKTNRLILFIPFAVTLTACSNFEKKSENDRRKEEMAQLPLNTSKGQYDKARPFKNYCQF
jgi:hypothetical protein